MQASEPSRVPIDAGEQFDIFDVVRVVWEGRLILLLCFVVATAGGLAYALTATPVFRAVVTVVSALERPSSVAGGGALSQIGAIAGLAGISLGSGSDGQEALAVLRSSDFAREYMQENRMIDVLLAESEAEQPDVRDALEQFQSNVLSVIEDRKSGLISVAIEWKDPKVAAQWANGIIASANERMRKRALVEHERNIGFLRQQLAQTNVVSLQNSISRLLEAELQRYMLARGNREYAFRVVDTALPPKKRSFPKRSLIVAGAAAAGVLLGLVLVTVRHAWRVSARTRRGAGAPG